MLRACRRSRSSHPVQPGIPVEFRNVNLAQQDLNLARSELLEECVSQLMAPCLPVSQLIQDRAQGASFIMHRLAINRRPLPKGSSTKPLPQPGLFLQGIHSLAHDRLARRSDEEAGSVMAFRTHAGIVAACPSLKSVASVNEVVFRPVADSWTKHESAYILDKVNKIYLIKTV